MLKKLVIGVSILTLTVSLAGCGTKKPAPATTQPSQNNVGKTTPEGHPAVTPKEHPSETPTTPDATTKTNQAQIESSINDLLAKKYPGDWKVSGSTLSKGNYTENNKYAIVDDIAAIVPDTLGVSIFVQDHRISSSVKDNTGKRVLEGYPTPPTVSEVMKNGKVTTTESSGFLKVYIPLKTADKTIAVMTFSIPD